MSENAQDWPLPMGDYAGTRAAQGSSINSETVSNLGVAWTFPIEASGTFGGMTAQPLIIGDTVYVQDMQSNVFALNRANGEVRWEKRYGISTIGPNGVAVGYGLVFGSLGDTAEMFALDAANGEEVWRVQLSNNAGEGIDVAPLVYDNVVYTSTVPGGSDLFYQGGTKGILFALDAKTGTTLHQWDTTAGEPTGNLWDNPVVNSGGGVWYPPSIDESGNIYFGTGNPGPWPGIVVQGTPFPNGSSRPGDNDYTNSMVSLDTFTWSIRWYHNAKPHDLFDLDFHLTPILATVTMDGQDRHVAIGGGKTGTVVAADRDTGEILWDVEVGMHENDGMTEIPEGETIRVYPGSLGGVETPMAYADGVVFVPIVNRWNEYTATEQAGAQPLNEATGALVALNAADGSVMWQVELPQMNVGGAIVANDVVFGSALDGILRAYEARSGTELWTFQATAGINATMAIADDLLILPAAGPLLGAPDGVQAQPAVIALQLGATGTVASGTPEAGTPVADGDQAQTEVTVEMVDLDFNPNEFTIPANTNVMVTLLNNGAALHNFNIDGHNNPSDPDLHSGDVQPGESSTVTLNLPAGDWYYYCNIAGHEAAGMFGTAHVVEQQR